MDIHKHIQIYVRVYKFNQSAEELVMYCVMPHDFVLNL